MGNHTDEDDNPFIPASQEEIDAEVLTPEDEARIPKMLTRVMLRFHVHVARAELERGEPVGKVVDDYLDAVERTLQAAEDAKKPPGANRGA
jgi:hypothetical protein